MYVSHMSAVYQPYVRRISAVCQPYLISKYATTSTFHDSISEFIAWIKFRWLVEAVIKQVFQHFIISCHILSFPVTTNGRHGFCSLWMYNLIKNCHVENDTLLFAEMLFPTCTPNNARKFSKDQCHCTIMRSSILSQASKCTLEEYWLDWTTKIAV